MLTVSQAGGNSTSITRFPVPFAGIGAGSVNQAIKAIIIARGNVQADNLDFTSECWLRSAEHRLPEAVSAFLRGRRDVPAGAA